MIIRLKFIKSKNEEVPASVDKKAKNATVPVTTVKKPKVSSKVRLHYIFTSIAIIGFYASIIISLHAFYSNLTERIEQIRQEQMPIKSVRAVAVVPKNFISSNLVFDKVFNI